MVIKNLISMAAIVAFSACSTAPTNTESDAIINNIMTRTSIRQYTSQQVEAEKVETILKAAMAAPTAVNKQPWAFVVIDQRSVLDTLASHTRSHQMLSQAPLAIVVCGDMDKALEGEAQPYWIEDCSAAMENLLLSAHGLGLGAVWLGVYPIQERVEQVSRTLALPANIVPLGIASIGYPAQSPEPKDKWNPEAVHSNKW